MTDAEIPAKKADLWEKTIVTALRDMQWRHKGANAVMPEGNVGLDGNAEKALGDGVVSAGERLFLLEIKSEARKRSDEWKKGDEKLVYESLKSLIFEVKSKDDWVRLAPEFDLSMRGHLFLYWSAAPGSLDPRLKPGALVVSPYLLDLLRLSPCKDISCSKSIATVRTLAAVSEEGDQRRYFSMNNIFASRLFTGSARLVKTGGTNDKPRRSAMRLGLTALEMQTYVDGLLSRQEEWDLPINAILASENGAVCQHLASVRTLSSLLALLIANPTVDQSILPAATESFDGEQMQFVEEEEEFSHKPRTRSGHGPKKR